jgi:myo-inositol-1(or 4)-monophosphatase
MVKEPRKVSDYGYLLDVARTAAGRAATHLRGVERPGPDTWERKGHGDYVTMVDRDTEQIIADSLLASTPDGSILGEELTPGAASDGLVWVVDPLDGTANFLHGYPAYAVSIAAAVDGDVVAGVVLDVNRGHLYHAVQGGGAWCDDQRLSVSRTTTPIDALIGTGFPFKAQHLLPAYLRQFAFMLSHTAGIRRAGAASLDFADVARGRFDGFWELHLAPWDIAAGALLIREAGGRVTDLDGNGQLLRHGAFVAGNPTIHEWLLGALRR